MSLSPPLELLHVVTGGRSGGRVNAVTEQIVRWTQDRSDVRLNTLDPLLSGRDHAAVVNARALVLTTPIYKASYAGSLKSWLDFLPVEAMWWKPTAIIGVGGSDHHYLALDSQLRLTLTWFGALCMPVSAYITPRDVVNGQLTEAAASVLDALVDSTCEVARRIADMSQRGPLPLAAHL